MPLCLHPHLNLFSTKTFDEEGPGKSDGNSCGIRRWGRRGGRTHQCAECALLPRRAVWLVHLQNQGGAVKLSWCEISSKGKYHHYLTHQHPPPPRFHKQKSSSGTPGKKRCSDVIAEPQQPPVVVIFKDLEAFNPKVLQDFILICRYFDRLKYENTFFLKKIINPGLQWSHVTKLILEK